MLFTTLYVIKHDKTFARFQWKTWHFSSLKLIFKFYCVLRDRNTIRQLTQSPWNLGRVHSCTWTSQSQAQLQMSPPQFIYQRFFSHLLNWLTTTLLSWSILFLSRAWQQVFRSIQTSLTWEFLVGLGNPIPIRGQQTK